MNSQLNQVMGTPSMERQFSLETAGSSDSNIGQTDLPPEGFEAVHYYPDGTFEEKTVFLSGLEIATLAVALEHANNALESGNPPVGAVLLTPDPENPGAWLDFGGSATDKTEKDIIGGHAEVKAWHNATQAGVVGDLLDDSVVVETVPPCSSCGPRLAEGKVMKIIVSATRREGWDASGGNTMRQRQYNVHHMLQDGHTDTVIVRGPGREAVLAKYTMWAEMHGFKNAPDISKVAELPLLEDLMISPQKAHAIKAH
ncbi:MAG TPA: hypothetical protein VG964_01870 [Candidatus Saccharimonadales bacterium]|nr:hypothetical protein [Candidatus Saccharimonadales bacterium]